MSKNATFSSIADNREVSVLTTMLAAFNESAKGRLWRDNNRVNWSIGHHNAIVRVDRLHDDLITKLPCNADTQVIDLVYNVSIDAIGDVDGTEQRVTRRIATIGFTPEEEKSGERSPYLLTGAGNLAVQTPQGEKQAVLDDGIGFVIKAYDRAAIHDDSHFWTTPLTRHVNRSPVIGQPVTLPAL